MSEGTRYARIQASVAPLRTVEGTRVVTGRTLAKSSVEGLFRARQRVMASALREEPRPGLFVFAAHLQYGHVARLWLEATEQPRAGLIGRHDEVDLALPLDDALSLRHLMFVVRRRAETVRFVVLDLESNNGLQLEAGDPVRLAEAAGPLIVCASDFVFFCFPTGQPIPWNPDSDDSWATLAPRRALRREPRARETSWTDRPVGRVEVGVSSGMRVLTPGNVALRRGVLIGRDGRCDLVVPETTVSRVHVVLLSLDDELLVIDSGSTNGLWRLDDELSIARLRDGEVLGLGREATLCWRNAH